MSKNNFVHFGCWNNEMYSNKGVNPISTVLKRLIANSGNYDFYVVAGDNYYPSK
jgi:hypothetical protein